MLVKVFFAVLPLVALGISTDFYDVCDRVHSLGLPCEHHVATTADGFQLDVVRIPPKNQSAYPVILQHGLLDCAVTWVVNYYKHQNLGSMLHETGYDVWMPNSRGNHYSLNNTNWTQSDIQYWLAIDRDGMARYDVPANIDLVLQTTGHSTLTYVGHSQGGFQGFAAFGTLHPEYAKKVDLFVALAPACWVAHSTSLLINILAGLDIDKWLELFGVTEFLLNDWLLRQFSKLCPDGGQLCPDLLDFFVGDGNPTNVNDSMIPHILRYDPGGTSVNNMVDWAQALRHGTFEMRDYGAAENQKVYNQSTPPQYNIANMTSPPTAIFWGGNDALADPQDVAHILSQLPASTVVANVSLPTFAHLDFVWGLDAHRLVYSQVLSLIGKYRR
jgi:pimeloyl-ACP methyl ester carboxylesterase